ncbi:MAG: rod shape-determining protein RodA [Clostridia bacterium]|nr:rod shape-determining protein RodA [Clostridia bacterium]
MWLFDKRKLHNIEYVLLIIVGALCLFGLIAIIAALADASPSGEETTLLEKLSRLNFVTARKHLIWIAISTVVMACIAMLDYHIYSKIWAFVLIVCLGLIVLTSFFGVVRGGTRGWIAITEDFYFQPTEVGKLALILILAKTISQKESLDKFRDLWTTIGAMGLFVAALLTQMDVGTSLVYVFIFAVMLFIGGMRWKHILIMVGVCIACCVAIWFILGEAQQSRIINFLSGEDVGQLKYSKIAIGSGGFFGKGILGLDSISQSGDIPAIHTDFIFSAIGESMGFIGGILLIGLYTAMEIRMWYLIQHKAHDRYGKMIIVGVMAMFMFHIFENIGMVMGIMPITGIPLPFVSYGGSSMLTNMIGIGLVESVCMNRPIEPFTSE